MPQSWSLIELLLSLLLSLSSFCLSAVWANHRLDQLRDLVKQMSFFILFPRYLKARDIEEKKDFPCAASLHYCLHQARLVLAETRSSVRATHSGGGKASANASRLCLPGWISEAELGLEPRYSNRVGSYSKQHPIACAKCPG